MPREEARVRSGGPLQDVRVVECASAGCPLAVRLALAFAGRVAADLGAQVTALRTPAQADLDRIEPRVAEHSALGLFLDAGKRFQQIADSSVAGAHLDGADVIFSDVALYETQAGTNPRAVWSVVSALGKVTDHTPQSEFTLMALSGLLDLVGDPLQAPLRLGGHQLAYAAGLAAYGGAIGALCAREADKTPDVVRISLADVGVWLNWKSVAMPSWSNRCASRQGAAAEWRTVRCADGWIALVCSEADWPALRELVGDPRLLEPRFEDRAERRKHAAHIAEIVQSAFFGYSRAQLRDAALEKRLPLGAVWSPLELENDPQNRARGFLQRVGPLNLLRPRLPILWDGHATTGEADR
jgi:crotonobetainyl-CoA:carnitine CoA-transferase CaiB-like acyl-CoA transferase